jgi:AAA domain/Bifunctional DNA primase/polymerase, N-terminal
MDDPRPDELLQEAARAAHRHRFAFAWTDALEGAAAKACSRGGSANWKNAKPLPDEKGAAVAFFLMRARKRNPAVVLGASGLVGLEADGDLRELCERFGIRLPPTVGVRSRRGSHRYFRPPPGRPPLKVQLDPSGVVVSEDGYLIGAGAIHPSGWVYRYDNGADTVAELPADVYDLLVELGGRTRAETRRRFAEGEPIPEGNRDAGIFWLAVELLRDGVEPATVLARTLEAGRTQCVPPLDEKLVRKQFRGAVKWVAEHPTKQERLRAEARRILERQARARNGEGPDLVGPMTGTRKRALERRSLRHVKAERVDWAIDKIIPLGTLSLGAGVGGLGKSALLLAWAKEITAAGGDVLIVSYEDAAAQVLRPRFEALGGDLDRLHELYVDVLDGSVSFPTDLPDLDRHIRETQARAVLIDPISASIDLRLDAHKDQDVRVVLGQLAHLAERRRLAVVMNAHLNKAPSSDPYLRINGSTAFYNAARSVLTVTRDPGEPDWQRLVAHHKSNYGPLAPVERWRVVPVTIASEGGPIEVMTMEFVEVAEDVSREDVLAPHPAGPEKLDKAVSFLRGMLADGEWHDSEGLVTLAGAAQVSERTLRRAALEELKVEHERRGFPSSTWWRLPSHAKPSPEDLA